MMVLPASACAFHTAVDTDLRSGSTILDVEGLDVGGAIVPADRLDETFVALPFDGTWTPPSQDVPRLERDLRQALIDANAGPEIYEHLARYRRQYLGAVVDGRRPWQFGPDVLRNGGARRRQADPWRRIGGRSAAAGFGGGSRSRHAGAQRAGVAAQGTVSGESGSWQERASRRLRGAGRARS